MRCTVCYKVLASSAIHNVPVHRTRIYGKGNTIIYILLLFQNTALVWTSLVCRVQRFYSVRVSYCINKGHGSIANIVRWHGYCRATGISRNIVRVLGIYYKTYPFYNLICCHIIQIKLSQLMAGICVFNSIFKWSPVCCQLLPPHVTVLPACTVRRALKSLMLLPILSARWPHRNDRCAAGFVVAC